MIGWIWAEKAVSLRERAGGNLAMEGCEYLRGKEQARAKDNNRASAGGMRSACSRDGRVSSGSMSSACGGAKVSADSNGGKRSPSTMQPFRGPRQHFP